jgi:hypothetical protein
MRRTVSFCKDALWLSFLFLILLFPWQNACAANGSRPCAEEIASYCKGVKPGGGRLLKCLKENESRLSPACREKFENIRKWLEEAKEACSGDVDRFCKDVQPGGGRILKCLREHSGEISPACSKIIAGVEKAPPNGKMPGQ